MYMYECLETENLLDLISEKSKQRAELSLKWNDTGEVESKDIKMTIGYLDIELDVLKDTILRRYGVNMEHNYRQEELQIAEYEFFRDFADESLKTILQNRIDDMKGILKEQKDSILLMI